MRKLLIALVTTTMSMGVPLAYAKTMKPQHNVGGYLELNAHPPYELKASLTPTKLPNNKSALPKSIEALVENHLSKYPATTAVLLMKDGKILLERYQGVGSENAEFFSMSIGKSLTSLTFGKALCNGLIPSVNVQAKTLVPEMAGTPFGDSTLHQLLTMSSGAYKPHKAGQPGYKNGIGWNQLSSRPFNGNPWPLRLGQVTIAEILWGKLWDDVLDKRPNKPGEIFSYKSGDSLSVGMVIQRRTEMSVAAYFEQEIWSKLGTEKKAHWESDKTGATVSSSGFQASLRDWGRIANWTLKQHRSNGCFSDYLKKATKSQIKWPRSYPSSFEGYGYQWWTDNKIAPGFWGLGYAGQMLAISPDTGHVLLKFSYRQDRGSGVDIYKLFRKFTEAG